MNKSTSFSPDYATARLRFRRAANCLGWTLEPHSIGRLGPNGEDLTIDVAWSENNNPERTLVISSGVHGVEGFFIFDVDPFVPDLLVCRIWDATRPKNAHRDKLVVQSNQFHYSFMHRFGQKPIELPESVILTLLEASHR